MKTKKISEPVLFTRKQKRQLVCLQKKLASSELLPDMHMYRPTHNYTIPESVFFRLADHGN